MGAAVAAPLEMTLQEARDRVDLAYGMLHKARRQLSSFEKVHDALTQRIGETHKLYSLYRTLDLLDRHRDASFTDYLTHIYSSRDVEAARTRISAALDHDGIRSTLETFRDEPERFGELVGETASATRAQAFRAADRFGRELEELLLERTPRRLSVIQDYLHTDDLDISIARSLPEAISQLEANRDVADDFLLEAVGKEESAERYLAEAARLTGGRYFAHSQLGSEVGFTVSVALDRYPEPEGFEATRFSRFQARLQDVDEIAGQIEVFVSARKKLQSEESSLGAKLRSERALIDRRSQSLGALARDRTAFRAHLAEAYRPDSVATVHEALKLHSRAHGRVATAVQLKEEPSRFGRLWGLPGSPARRNARIAAAEAAHRLRAFETHRRDLSALPGRRPAWHLKHLETELARVRRRLARIPPLRGYQQQLARALEAAGGLSRVASYLSAPALSHIDRALRLVRSLEGAHER